MACFSRGILGVGRECIGAAGGVVDPCIVSLLPTGMEDSTTDSCCGWKIGSWGGLWLGKTRTGRAESLMRVAARIGGCGDDGEEVSRRSVPRDVDQVQL